MHSDRINKRLRLLSDILVLFLVRTSWATSMSQPSLSSWRVTKKSAQLAKMLAVTNKAVLLELKHFCCLDTAITKEV